MSKQNTLKTFLTPSTLANRWEVTTITLRRWRKAGKLPAHHLGRGIRFALEDVERIEREARVDQVDTVLQ